MARKKPNRYERYMIYVRKQQHKKEVQSWLDRAVNIVFRSLKGEL